MVCGLLSVSTPNDIIQNKLHPSPFRPHPPHPQKRTCHPPAAALSHALHNQVLLGLALLVALVRHALCCGDGKERQRERVAHGNNYTPRSIDCA